MPDHMNMNTSRLQYFKIKIQLDKGRNIWTAYKAKMSMVWSKMKMFTKWLMLHNSRESLIIWPAKKSNDMTRNTAGSLLSVLVGRCPTVPYFRVTIGKIDVGVIKKNVRFWICWMDIVDTFIYILACPLFCVTLSQPMPYFLVTWERLMWRHKKEKWSHNLACASIF